MLLPNRNLRALHFHLYQSANSGVSNLCALLCERGNKLLLAIFNMLISLRFLAATVLRSTSYISLNRIHNTQISRINYHLNIWLPSVYFKIIIISWKNLLNYVRMLYSLKQRYFTYRCAGNSIIFLLQFYFFQCYNLKIIDGNFDFQMMNNCK